MECKRWNHKRSRKKWKHADSSNSNPVVLTTLPMAPIMDFHQVISALTTLLMTLTLTLSPVKTSLYNISTQQGWKNFKWKKVWPRTGRGKEFLPFFSFFIFPYPHTLAFLMNPFLNLLLPDHTIARSFITLTYKSADEILRCYLSNKTSWAELSHSTVYFARF